MQIFKSDKRVKDVLFIIIEIVTGVILLSAGGRETRYFKDSETFIFWSTLNYRRGYTLYPLFIKMCRSIFGESRYIASISMVQLLLALISIIILTKYIMREYDPGYMIGLIIYFVLYLPFTFTLPEAMATHYIFTEGISISLFYVSFYILLHLLKRVSWSWLFGLLVINYMLFLTRPQLIIIPIVEFIILIIEYIYTKHLSKKYKLRALLNLIITMSIILFMYISLGLLSDIIYDRVMENQLIDSISGKVICTISDDNISDIEDRDKDILKAIYDFANERGTLEKVFPDSWLEYEDIHVSINTNLRDYEQVVWECIEENHPEYDSEASYRARNRVLSRLLSANKGKYMGIIFRLMPSSMVASIFVQPHRYRLLCYLITLVMYIISVGIMIYTLFKGLDEKYRYPHIATLIIIVFNSLFCNITLYGQQRYVIYCMGLFYVTMLLALIGCYRNYKEKGRMNE